MDWRERSLLFDPVGRGTAMPGNSLAEVIEKSWQGPQPDAGFPSGIRDSG
jgi:hypothetical protein